MPGDPTNSSDSAQSSMQTIDWILIAIVSTVLLSLTIFLLCDLSSFNSSYDTIIKNIIHSGEDQDVLAYSRAKDFNNMKSITLIVSFLLIFIGAIYLLKVFNLNYKFGLDNPSLGKIDLQATSPGLVMITLGVILNIAILMTKTEINTEVSGQLTVNDQRKADSLLHILDKALTDSTFSKQSHKIPKINKGMKDLKSIKEQLKLLLERTPQIKVMTHDT